MHGHQNVKFVTFVVVERNSHDLSGQLAVAIRAAPAGMLLNCSILTNGSQRGPRQYQGHVHELGRK